MLRHLFAFLISFCLFTCIFNSVSYAHHYLWMVDDPRFDEYTAYGPRFEGKESYISWWLMNGAATTYTADESIRSEVVRALAAWNINLPSRVNITGPGDDLKFQKSDSKCFNADDYACYLLDNVYFDKDRNANFVTKATIVVTSNATSNSLPALAHEIGHYLGFDEQYYDLPVGYDSDAEFCNSRYTVMNGGTCDNPSGPSWTDIELLNNVILGEKAQATIDKVVYLSPNAVNPASVLSVSFKDESLGEQFYYVNVYAVSSSGAETYVTGKEEINNTGLWKGVRGSDLVSTKFYGLDLANGTYRVKVAPYYASSRKTITANKAVKDFVVSR